MKDSFSQPNLNLWNIGPVVDFLSANNLSDAEALWQPALMALSSHFPSSTWVVSKDINTYGPGAHKNLYQVESQKGFRDWLKQNNVSVEDYALAVGEIQYISIQFQLKSLLADSRSNKGWRIRVIGFPAIRIVGFGLASHYQGTQNHNAMGRASSLIRTNALQVLTGTNQQVMQSWPSATSDHWEGRGLMHEPVHRIGALDISSFDLGQGAELRMIRNTTVKKELSTFFAIKSATFPKFLETGSTELQALRQIALELGEA